jgi:hypothetical protein
MPHCRLSRSVRLGRAVLAAVAATGLWPVVADAVLVAPHALFLGERHRTGQIYLVNQSATPEEVEIEFQFGYPESDSAGGMRVRLIPEPDADAPSAAAWLRAFPRRLRLDAGQRQAVRIQATPPDGLPPGEYWSRLIVTSRQERPSALAGGDSAVRAGVTVELRTVTSVTYRAGPLETGIRLDSARAGASGDTLEAWVGLTRTGRAAYLGSVGFTLLDQDGQLVRQWPAGPVAVYYALHRRYVLPLDGVTPGVYRLRVDVSTAREDIAPEHVLPAAPVQRTIGVEVR